MHPEKKAHYIGMLLPPQLLDALLSAPSWHTFELMGAARRRGLNIFLHTFSYCPHRSMEDATNSKARVNNGVCKLEAITVNLEK